MDVKFVQPFFRDGRLWCWLANTGHWPDTGGMVPGGFSANATEVEQEGLRLPPVKLYKKGVLDDEILSIILSNIRIADQRIGDIKAQAAALATGQARLAALLDRYGDATVDAAIVELKRRAARQMREKIATIPDGVYEGEAFVDSDGVVDEPLRIAMRITKTGGSDVERAALSFDMSGSSPPCKGPMNSVIATTRSSIYLAVKHVFPGSGDQRRHLRAAAHRRSRRHLPLRALSAPGLGLRRRGQPAHRRGGVRGARPRRSPTSSSARRPEPAATSASAASTRRRTAPT